jgi:hypothetical protein
MKKLFTLLFATCFSVAMFGQEAIPAGGTWATARGIINTNFSLVAPKASPTFTGAPVLPEGTWKIGLITITANGTEINLLDGLLSTAAELNRLVGYDADSVLATRNYVLTHSGIGDLSASDTADMLSPYALLSETGTGDLSASDTATMLSPYALLSEISATEGISAADTADMLANYTLVSEVRDEIADSLNVLRSGALDISDITPLLADTIPLVTFGAGSGLIADTALMNNNVLIGCFYNDGSDTLKITKLSGILKEGTGTETISVQISWHATMLSGSATSLNAAALAITSMTTGTVDTSFANSKIPPGVFVWGILSAASANNKPTFLSITLSGYKIPKY